MTTRLFSIRWSRTLLPVMFAVRRSNTHYARVTTLCFLLFFIFAGQALSQGRLILNGAKINVTQGAYLVVDNAATDAMTRTVNGGHIITEGQSNRIKWNIGTATGTYIVPLGYGNSDYTPLTFTKAAGSGSGHFLFSTYHTAWNNISQLPTGVTNINGAGGTDNSAFVSDRFWQVNAQGYTTKPGLTNLIFTYLDTENAGPNTITESGLRAKRYNSTLNSWVDNLLSSTTNTSANSVTVSSIDATNLQAWWMLGSLSNTRYWVAPSNSNSNVAANWSEVAGGSGNAGVPTTSDAVFFNSASNFNCVLNSDLQAASITVDPTFVGVITQGSNAITVANNAVFSGGTFLGGSAPITVNGNFTVSGSAFTAPVSTLDLKGNFSVSSGSFTHNSGTVTFSGTTTQTISSTAPVTFKNISVTNSAANPAVRVQSNENLAGVLTLASNVNFDADGSSNTSIFKLLSTGDSPTQDAAVAILPTGAQVSGNVTVQRFMSKEGSNSNRIYRYISSPVQNATVADLQQEIPVSGSFTGRSTCSGCSATNQSLFSYTESVLTDTDGNGFNNQHDGYKDFPDVINSETFEQGRGYALFVRGNILSSTLWDVRGPINTGIVTPVSLPVTYTSSGTLANDGWNLVGNPFPSTIDWNSASGWTKTNLESSIYITDNGSAASLRTAAWNGVVGTNGGSRHISMGQGFWVKANGGGAPVLQALEGVKVAGTQTTFFREEQPSTLLRITLAQGAVKDETVIHFREDATAAFDTHADARKLPNSIVNISSILPDGKTLAINSLATFDCSTAIPLTIDEVAAGNYKLDFSQLETFPNEVSVFLQDNFTGSTFDARSGSSYNFTVTTAPATFGANRFKITFSALQLNENLQVSASTVCVGGDAEIKIASPQTGVAYRTVADNVTLTAVEQDGAMMIRVPASSLHAGENKFIIQSSTAYCNTTIDHEVVVQTQPMVVPTVEAASNCGSGSVALKASGAPENATYNWYEDATSTLPIEGNHGDVFETPSLKKSKTYYVAITNALGCEGERVAVKASITILDAVTIVSSATTLTSNYAEGNQWYFNDELIVGATGQTIQPAQSGTYRTEIIVQGCTTSSEANFTIPAEEEITPTIPPAEEEEVTPTPEEETTEEETVTSAEEVNFYNIISISPNPFRETAMIQISNSFKNVTKVRVMNSVGQILQSVELLQEDGKKVGYIHLGNQPAGVYLVQIFSTTGVHERKIIKK